MVHLNPPKCKLDVLSFILLFRVPPQVRSDACALDAWRHWVVLLLWLAGRHVRLLQHLHEPQTHGRLSQLQPAWLRYVSTTIPVADLGFPRGCGAYPPEEEGCQHMIYQISPKNCMKVKEFGPDGGSARPKFYYVDPPLNIFKTCHFNLQWRIQDFS